MPAHPAAEPMARARELFRAGEVHAALESAQVAAERAPRNAETWWLLARVTRHAGLLQASDQAFRRAAELSRRKPQPHRTSEAEFKKLLAGAEAALSPDARRRLSATEIVVLDLPAPVDLRSGVDPDALAKRMRKPVDQLTLYRTNLENRCASPESLQALIARTLGRA